MTFAPVTLAAWRAQVEKELAGKPFDKALVHQTLEGIAIAPLYTEAPHLPRVLGDGAPFRICVRHGPDATEAAVLDDLEGGADAIWLPRAAAGALPAGRSAHAIAVIDEAGERECVVGETASWLVSALPFHAQGADACDEIALALSAAVERLTAGPRPLLVRVGAGRDTFVELSKLRALRLTHRKMLAAWGAPSTALTIHAVASPRTIAARDPWVNMLRVTTQLFAAVLGGADLVTPLPFDDALSPLSALGRRLARNTGHVLREESALGRVVDPGAGSYYLDSLTDSIAREAWTRFRAIEGVGGLAKALATGFVEERIHATRRTRRDAIARRKLPVLGVSEFANLDEVLPGRPRDDEAAALRDDAAFEALRERADALPGEATEVLLATLGPFAESRARVGFATTFFAAGGLRARELGADEPARRGAIACLCGSDERYAAEAAARARVLRDEGCRHVLLAGRPGALEGELREAGVDGFLFLGGDVVATLAPLLEAAEGRP
jgi:methylmalonyl-CoA mutase